MSTTLSLRLRAMTWEADGILGFEFAPAAPNTLLPAFDAGAHIDLHLPNGLVRSYSLLNTPGERHRYCIAVNRDAASRGGSRWMHEVPRPGDLFTTGAPRNNFALSEAAPLSVFVAGGIGITPILGMALTLAAGGASLRMLYAARDEAELIFADRLQPALGDRLQTYIDRRGERIDLDAEIRALPPRAQVLVCGPVPLLQATQSAWAQAGRRAADLRFETFGSSGSRAAEAFWVSVPRQGKRFEVPANRSLLDVLGEHGVQTLFDCCRGECGLCAVDIVELHGEVDHRDVFLSTHEKQRNERLCACVSRVTGGGVVLDPAWRPDTPGAATP
jgi:vanillate O-demethylase ferredoxin subunit